MKKFFSKESIKSKAEYALQSDTFSAATHQYLEGKKEERRSRQSSHPSEDNNEDRDNLLEYRWRHESVSSNAALQRSAPSSMSPSVNRQIAKESTQVSAAVYSGNNVVYQDDYNAPLPVEKSNGLQRSQEERIIIPVEKHSIFT